jgi:ElaB/YqjD/DUF883 family membrane-anchored ribosome-binding protein
VGTVVNRARRLPSRIGEFKERLGAEAHRYRAEDSNKTDELTSQAEAKVRQVREEARRYSRQNPLATLAFAGIVGLVLGFGLRLWRDHRG